MYFCVNKIKTFNFPSVDGPETVVDLSLPSENTAETGSAPDQLSTIELAEVTKSGLTGSTAGTGSTSETGSTTVTNTSSASSTITFKDGPFAASLNQDFSFFMDQNSQPPNGKYLQIVLKCSKIKVQSVPKHCG